MPSTNWRDYRAVARESLSIGFNLAYDGNFGVIDPGGDMEVQLNSILFGAGSYAAADSLEIKENTSVQDVFTNALVQRAGSVVNGSIAPVSLPLFAVPPLPAAVSDPCTAAAANVVVPAAGSLSLGPGCYGDVIVNDNAELDLAAGVYKLRNLSVRLNAKLITGPGFVSLNVAGDVNTEESAYIAPTSGNRADLDVFVGGTTVNLAKFSHMTGAVFAPNAGDFQVLKEAYVSGPLLGRRLAIIGTHTPGTPTPTPTATPTPTSAIVPPDKARLHLPVAEIIFRDQQLDNFQVHIGVKPATPIDPLAEKFSVKLANANGTIFEEILLPGSFVKKGPRYFFRDVDAKTLGGFFRVTITPKPGGFYRLDVESFGDLSAATLANMTLEVMIGNDLFPITKDFTQTKSGWVLNNP